ncbi:C4-dicarboxylate ABC transporter substrate-binding protein [Synergistales bacterium]|nr:C4-dicarboxylate ABC transporter substrate-binding protein [Synergistales bacterium]
MKWLLQTLEKAYKFFLVTLTSIVILLGIYQVVGRYLVFLRLPISWTEEAMRYLHAAIIMLGVSAVSKADSFTTITLFSDIITRKSRIGGKTLRIASIVVQAVFFTLLLYYGALLAIRSAAQMTPTTKVSFGLVYLPIPIGGLMGLIHSLCKLCGEFISDDANAVKELR